MDKLGRNYKLRIQTFFEGDFIEVEPPFTIDFSIARNILGSANTSRIFVYNLSESNRSRIRHDEFNFGVLQAIELQAGYGNNLATIFKGNIQMARSYREGVGFLTEIESYDGGFAFVNGLVNQSFPANTPNDTVIRTLFNYLPGVSPGVIGDIDGSIRRGNAYSGNTAEILNQLTGGGFFIDNGKANYLNDNECIAGETFTIDSSSGLLGTPQRSQTFLHLDMIFEPRLSIGQKVHLDSSTGANYNGDYRVISLEHRGMISAAVCGEVITKVGLAYGIEALQVVGA